VTSGSPASTGCSRRDALCDTADCLIVVAGMDGALPSVVGGLVGTPLVAVPTSIGYGASLGGIAALLTMLNSCAPGVTVRQHRQRVRCGRIRARASPGAHRAASGASGES